MPAPGTSTTGQYPIGSFLFNEFSGRTYRNGNTQTNSTIGWVDTNDPTDMIAGSLAFGVEYGGTINVAQLNAGNVSVALNFTMVGGGHLTVVNPTTGNTIDMTNGFIDSTANAGGFSESGIIGPGTCSLQTIQTSTGANWVAGMGTPSGRAYLQLSAAPTSSGPTTYLLLVNVSTAEVVITATGGAGTYGVSVTAAGVWFYATTNALTPARPSAPSPTTPAAAMPGPDSTS